MSGGTTSDHEGLRLRRTQSVTRAEEIQAVEQKVRKSQPDKPYVLVLCVLFTLFAVKMCVTFTSLGNRTTCTTTLVLLKLSSFNGQCNMHDALTCCLNGTVIICRKRFFIC